VLKYGIILKIINWPPGQILINVVAGLFAIPASDAQGGIHQYSKRFFRKKGGLSGVNSGGGGK
jgi:hypothetical protein